MMKSVQLKAARELFRAVKEKASRLDYYAGLIRVTHTTEQLESLLKSVHAVDKIAKDPNRFVEDFIFNLRRCRVGSMNVEHLNDKEISISGTFSIEYLRDMFMVADGLPETIDVKSHE